MLSGISGMSTTDLVYDMLSHTPRANAPKSNRTHSFGVFADANDPLMPHSVVFIFDDTSGKADGLARLGVPLKRGYGVRRGYGEREEHVYTLPCVAPRAWAPEDGECSVCMSCPKEWMDYSCGHANCYSCVKRWSQTCPQCRAENKNAAYVPPYPSIEYIDVSLDNGWGAFVPTSATPPAFGKSHRVRVGVVLDLVTGWFAEDYASLAPYFRESTEWFLRNKAGIHRQLVDVMRRVGPRRCTECREPGELRCSVCKDAWYCSRTCQRKAWKHHKPECRVKSA
jgi:hypothetical protein